MRGRCGPAHGRPPARGLGTKWGCVRTATQPAKNDTEEEEEEYWPADEEHAWFDEDRQRWVCYVDEYEEVEEDFEFQEESASPRVVRPARPCEPTPPRRQALPTVCTPRLRPEVVRTGVPAGVEVHGIGTDSRANTSLSFATPLAASAGLEVPREGVWSGRGELPRAPGHNETSDQTGAAPGSNPNARGPEARAGETAMPGGMEACFAELASHISRFVEAQTDNISRSSGITKRVPPVFTANSPELLYEEIRAIQLHWGLQRVAHRRQWFEEARTTATGRARLIIDTYVSTVLGGYEGYQRCSAEGDKEFWSEHWDGLMRQLRENSGVKPEILLTTAINRYEGVRLTALARWKRWIPSSRCTDELQDW